MTRTVAALSFTGTMPEQIRHSRPWITEEDIAALTGLLESEMLAAGDVTYRFERAVEDRCGLHAARFLGSGRIALAEALRLVGVTAGDEVLIPTYVCQSVRE